MNSGEAHQLFSGCKINLFLRVGLRLPSGMHHIDSLFLPLPLPGDRLELRLLSDPAPALPASLPGSLSAPLPGPLSTGPPLTRFFDEQGAPLAGIDPKDNTLIRAWTWFRELCGFAPRLYITVRKGVPCGAGLGGGSANAASLLLFLRKQALKQGLVLPRKRDFVRQSAAVGADVPFFLLNRPALARGVGERLCPCANPFAGRYLLLLCPDLPVNTGQSFAALDRWREEGHAPLPPELEEKGPEDCALNPVSDGLRRPGAPPPDPVSDGLRRPGAPPPDPARGMMPLDPLWGSEASGAIGASSVPGAPALVPVKGPGSNSGRDFVNDFEGPIFRQLPELAALYAELDASGALLARMSGSGSSLFAIYADRKSAANMVKILADRGLRVYMQRLPQR